MGHVESEVRPSWPARLPFYYGWVNVVLATVAMSATLPGRTYGLGLIKEPLRAELGISDLRFNWLNAWAIVLGAVLVPPVGWLIDRIGTRWTLTFVSSALAGCVFAMSRVTDETQLFVSLTLVRGLGQGALSVVAIALVGKWFRRRAGIAMGLFTLLLSVGFVVPIFTVGEVVKQEGWRTAWDAVGFGLLFGLVPLGLLLARSSPEACGVTPDEPVAESAQPVPMTLLAAIRTPSFWVYTAVATIFNLTFSALTLDNELLLKEHGLDPTQANAFVLGILMVSGLVANIATGALSGLLGLVLPRQPLGKMLGFGVLILAGSLAFFPRITTLTDAAVYAALLGAAGGVITVIYFAVYGHSYGRTHLGSIQAMVQVLSVLASAIGPVLLADCRDQMEGKTDAFFYVFAAVALVLAVAAWVVRPPVRN